jgi:putative FmdB family regulatory protein
MPVYEFMCRNCRHGFEIAHPISQSHGSDLKCPKCGSRDVDRAYSSIYAVTSKKS